jgi:hypothetical protein
MTGSFLGTIGLHSGTLSTIALAICLVGVFLLWSSKIWHTNDKVIGVALIPIGFWIIELIRVVERMQSGGFFVIIDRALVIFIVVTDVIVSIGTLIFLIYRLRKETQADGAARS